MVMIYIKWVCKITCRVEAQNSPAVDAEAARTVLNEGFIGYPEKHHHVGEKLVNRLTLLGTNCRPDIPIQEIINA